VPVNCPFKSGFRDQTTPLQQRYDRGILLKSRDLVGRVAKDRQRWFVLLLKELYRIQDRFTFADDGVSPGRFARQRRRRRGSLRVM